MKKLLKSLALISVAAATLVSCAKEERITRTDDISVPSARQMYAFDISEEVTEATLNNEGVFWESGDAVGIYLNGYGNYDGNVDTESSPKRVILGNTTYVLAGTKAYPYYPFDEGCTTATAVTFNIPNRQTGGDKSAMPMVGVPFTIEDGGAASNNGVIHFLNLASIIDFRVYSANLAGESIQYITFKADGGTLSGDAVMNLTTVDPYDETTLAISSWGEHQYDYVTVRQNEDVAVDINSAPSIYMVLAPGTYSGTITIETDAALYTFPFTDKKLDRNGLKHYTMNLDNATRQAIQVKTVPYSEAFTSNKGAFVIEGSTSAWTYYSNYGAKVSGSNINTALVSPWINLSGLEGATLSFQHAINSSFTDGLAGVYILAEGDSNWSSLDVAFPEKPASSYSSFLTVTKDISAWVGQKVRIKFEYNSGSNGSAAWEVKAFSVTVPKPVYYLYSGTLTEGDYVIYYNGKAMKNTVSSSRLDYTEVTPSNNQIEDPDASIVWHIAPSGEYWTIYNAAVNKYAAANGTKNQAQLLASGTDDKSLWTVSGTSTYEFVNKNNDSNGVNANLRNNASYGFATYSTSTGGPLTLYKRGSGGSSSGGGQGGGEGDEPIPVSGLHGYLGCLEMPDVTEILSGTKTSGTYSDRDDRWYRYYTKNNKRQIATHTFTHPTSNQKTRTYTVLYDETNYAPLWTATAMHSSMWPDKNVGRNDGWTDDPAISLAQQGGLDNAGTVGYSRGHLVASNYRQSTVKENKQTFYHSNQAPQWQNSFNSGVWSSMEEAVAAHLPSGRDTLYMVIGVLYEGTIKTLPSGSKNVRIPSHFYTCLMKCSFNTSGNMTSAKGIGYIFTNEAHSGMSYSQGAATIDSIEERAGFNFFANVPESLQNTAEATATALW